jgi:ribosomal protein S18 acetylase RimI-like enzyme
VRVQFILRLAVNGIIEALNDSQVAVARMLFEEYAASIDTDLCFQSFAQELAGLPGKYAPPKGGLFVAFIGEQPVGCVALRPTDQAGIAELKRLYVRSIARGRKIGLALTQHAIGRAREAGYDRVRLDTLPSMQDAQRLYRWLGFKEIPAYTYNPVPDVVYMELQLQPGEA